MIDHQTFEVKQIMTQTFMLKVQQKESTVRTSSQKFTLTCVNMHLTFAKVVSPLVYHKILAGGKTKEFSSIHVYLQRTLTKVSIMVC